MKLYLDYEILLNFDFFPWQSQVQVITKSIKTKVRLEIQSLDYFLRIYFHLFRNIDFRNENLFSLISKPERRCFLKRKLTSFLFF